MYPDNLPLSPAARSGTRIRMQFTGEGGEYFRIWIVSLLLTVGRILYAMGLSTAAEKSTPPRLIGTLMTWLAQIIAAIGCLYYALY